MKLDLIKKMLTLVCFIPTLSGFGQLDFDTTWNEINTLEKKGLYREALKKVDIILDEATKSEKSTQIIKASFFQLKYNQYITEDDYVLGIHRIEKLIETVDNRTGSILKSVLAEVYFGYYSRNSWKYSDRTVYAGDIKPDDIRTWDLEMLAKKVIDNYLGSIENIDELNSIKISEFPELITADDNAFTSTWTLYHFLADRAFKFFSSNSFNIEGPAQTFKLNDDAYFGSNESFIGLKISTPDSFNLSYYATEVIQATTKDFQKKKTI